MSYSEEIMGEMDYWESRKPLTPVDTLSITDLDKVYTASIASGKELMTIYGKCVKQLAWWKFLKSIKTSKSDIKHFNYLISDSRCSKVIRFIETYILTKGVRTWTKESGNRTKMKLRDLVNEIKKYIVKGWKKIGAHSLISLIPKGKGLSDGLRPICYPAHIRKFYEYIVYQELKEVVNYSDGSFAYREGRSTQNAVRMISDNFRDGYNTVLNADLSDAFDGVSRDWINYQLKKSGATNNLLQKVIASYDVIVDCKINCRVARVADAKQSIEKLILANKDFYTSNWCKVISSYTLRDDDGNIHYIKKGVSNEAGNYAFVWKCIKSGVGTPQGGVCSPILFNIAFERLHTDLSVRFGSDLRIVRYADDFVIMLKDESIYSKVLDYTEWYVKNLANVSLNREKTYRSFGSCKFVGYVVSKEGIAPNFSNLLNRVKPDHNQEVLQSALKRLLKLCMSCSNEELLNNVFKVNDGSTFCISHMKLGKCSGEIIANNISDIDPLPTMYSVIDADNNITIGENKLYINLIWSMKILEGVFGLPRYTELCKYLGAASNCVLNEYQSKVILSKFKHYFKELCKIRVDWEYKDSILNILSDRNVLPSDDLIDSLGIPKELLAVV